MYSNNSGLGFNSNRFAFNNVSWYSKVVVFKSTTALILKVGYNAKNAFQIESSRLMSI